VKAFLRHRSPRWGFDGWAIRIKGDQKPLAWTVSTTREEARDMRRERGNLLRDSEIVKVRIVVEAVEG